MANAAVSHWIRRIRETKEQHGNWAAVRLLADRLGGRLFKTTIMNVLRLEARQLSDTLPDSGEFTLRFLSDDEVREFSQDPSNDLPAAFVSKATSRGDRCFAALSESRLAAYGWYALHSIQAEYGGGIAVSFPKNMSYMYRGYTHPDFRGRRLHGLLMSHALRELSSEGVEQLVSTVDWTNWPSLKSCYRLGYTDLGRVVSIGRPGRQTTLAPRRATGLGVRFGREAEQLAGM